MGHPSFSRDNHDPRKLYLLKLLQQGVPIFDADWNDALLSLMYASGQGASAVGTFMEAHSGFGVFSGGTNDFTFSAPSAFSRGQTYFHRGFPYKVFAALGGSGTNPTFGGSSLTSSNLNYLCDGVITALPGGNVITDSHKTWKTEHYLTGWRVLMLTGAEAGNVFTVSSYTAGTSSLTLSGVGSIAVNDTYRLYPPALTTPSGSDRTDDLYLMLVGMMVDTDEDPDIEDPTLSIESVQGLLSVAVLVVDEGQTGALVSEVPATVPEANDPTLVRYVKIAEIARTDGVATLVSGDFTEYRPTRTGEGFLDSVYPKTGTLNVTFRSASDASFTVNNVGAGRGSITLTDGDVVFSAAASRVQGTTSLKLDVRKSTSPSALDILNDYTPGTTYVLATVNGNLTVAQVGGGQGIITAADYTRNPAQPTTLLYTAREMFSANAGGAAEDASSSASATPSFVHNHTAGGPSQAYVTQPGGVTDLKFWLPDQIPYDSYIITALSARIWRDTTAVTLLIRLVEFDPLNGGMVALTGCTWVWGTPPTATTWTTYNSWGTVPTYPLTVPSLTSTSHKRYWEVELQGGAATDLRIAWFSVSVQRSTMARIG